MRAALSRLAASGKICHDRCGLDTERKCQRPGCDARPTRKRKGAPLVGRRKASEPGASVHGRIRPQNSIGQTRGLRCDAA